MLYMFIAIAAILLIILLHEAFGVSLAPLIVWAIILACIAGTVVAVVVGETNVRQSLLDWQDGAASLAVLVPICIGLLIWTARRS